MSVLLVKGDAFKCRTVTTFLSAYILICTSPPRIPSFRLDHSWPFCFAPPPGRDPFTAEAAFAECVSLQSMRRRRRRGRRLCEMMRAVKDATTEGGREGGRDGQSSMYTSRRITSHHTGHGRRTADVNSDGHDAITADGLAEEDLLDYCITIYNVLLLMPVIS